MQKIVSKYVDQDDALHPFDTPDYYEWWYLDALFDNGYSCALSCFWRTSYQDSHIPLIIIDIYPPDGNRIRGAEGFDYKDCRASLEKCDVSLGKNYIKQEAEIYKVSLHAENTGVELVYKRKLPGWKWTRDGLMKNNADGIQGWINAIPRADVTGNLFLGNEIVPVKGQGYHDHNWGNVDMSRSFAGWGWGRMYDPKYTFVYGWFIPFDRDMPILPSLYVARDRETIFASPSVNGKLNGEVVHEESGNSLPTDILIRGKSADVEVSCRLHIISVIEHMKTGPDNGGFMTNYYRRLNKYDARIVVDGESDKVRGEALNEYVMLHHQD